MAISKVGYSNVHSFIINDSAPDPDDQPLNIEGENIENPSNLKAANAAGDDSTLASHGHGRKYWYSVGDGYRLLLTIRKTFTYANEAISGEEYSAYRENRNRVFITDPYHIDNFDSCLEDDSKKIHGSHEIAASNRQWTQPPQIIIIPILTGVHWRCLRLEIDYPNKKINILFDDPYGKNRFDETIKTKLKTSLIKNLDRLFTSTTVIKCEEQDKVINQQGVGNGYDCGPIVFSNIADYADIHKNNRILSRGEGLRITSAEDTQHESLMISIRAEHIAEYASIVGVKIDEARVNAIKKLMHAENETKLAAIREHNKIDQYLLNQIAQLPAAYVSMIFSAVEEGIDIRDAYENINAEYLAKSFSPLPANSVPLLYPFNTPILASAYSAFSPASLVTPSPKAPMQTHPAHINLQGQRLSVEDLQQWWEEIRHNKLIGHITWGILPSGEETRQLCNQIELQIIQNNKSYQPYPSDFIYGVLSAHIYEEAEVDKTVTFKDTNYHRYHADIKQWTVHSVHSFPEWGGYYGVIYKNVYTRQLVLAHRGTTAALTDLFKAETHLNTDIKGILGGEIVRQHEAVRKVTQLAVDYAKKCNYHFSTTGHSLGAWLAEISVYFSEFEFEYPAKAVTFDSPGSVTRHLDPNIKNAENKRNIEDLEITTYLSDPNFVNTCNQHVGQVYRVYPDYKKYSTNRFVGTNLDRMLGVNLAGVRSVLGHSLGPILATLDPNSEQPIRIDKMLRWPVIKYKTRDTVGNNVLTKSLGTAGQNVQQSSIAQLINLLVDVYGVRDIAQNLMASSLSNPAITAIQQSTMASIATLVEDTVAGRLDQTQYLQCWEILSKPENIKAGKILKGDQFTLKYKGSYEAVDPLTGQLISRYQGDADWYLDKLHTCPPEKIAQYLGQDSLITKQLSALQTMYKITPQRGHSQIISHDTPIKAIRERLLRLLEVTEGKIAEFLQTHEKKPLSSSPLKLTRYLPPSLGKQYILREENIQQIDQILVDHPYAIISGEPGLGKTTLAIEYGHTQTAYPIVRQVNADSQEKIDAEYRKIAVELGIHKEQQDTSMVIQLVNSKISSQQEKVLLIFDNVEAYAHIKPYLDYLPANTKALITTRQHRLVAGVCAIRIQPFTPGEAKQYIETSAIKDMIQDTQEVNALVKHYTKGTGYVAPYYLNRAIALIKNNPLGSISDYSDDIKTCPDDEGELFLQQKLMAKSELAWPMLQYAAFLDPDSIDIQIFTQLFNVDKKALNEAIKIVESLSAMYVVRRAGQQPALTLHRLTQGIVKKFIKNPAHQASCISKTDILLKLAESLNALCLTIDGDSKSWPQAKKLMPHIDRVLAKLPDTLSSPQIAELWTKSGEYAGNILGTYKQAFNHYQKSLEMQQKLYPNQLQTGIAQSLNDVGYAYLHLGGVGNTEKGIILLEQALDMWQKLYPDQSHSGIAYSLNYLGSAYQSLGGAENHRKGLDLQEQALAMQKVLHADQAHPDVAAFLNNVGIAYQNLGGVKNSKKGLDLQEQALAMQKILHADQAHPNVAIFLSNLGSAYQNLGGVENSKKGLDLQEQALAMQKILHADQAHPDVAISLNNVGSTYQNLGGVENRKKGLDLQEQALAMQKILHADQAHPDVAASLNNVGIAYRNLGGVENRKKGLDLQEQALAMRQTLSENQPHPEIAQSLYDIGYAYVALGDSTKGFALIVQSSEMKKK